MNEKLNCVMLIDDDEPTNFLSSIIIEEAECAKNIQIMDSGIKALDYLFNSQQPGRSNKDCPWPELIFLDINMPAMNGWEFLDKYKGLNTGHGEVIIIMLTTSLNPDDKIKAGKIPAISGFEIKPLTPELLDTVISKYFTSGNCTLIEQPSH